MLDGDETAFRELYHRHAPYVFRLALQLTGGDDDAAHDILQETWLKVIHGLDRFRRDSSFRTWIASIAARTSYDHLRRRSAEPFVRGDMPELPSPRGSDPHARIDLERVLRELPAGYRTVLILHDVEGFKHREIARIMGIRVGTSKSQLSRAREWMRGALTPSHQGTPHDPT